MARMMRFSPASMVPRTKSATAAGTNVSDSTSAAVNAITTVIAMG